jgi:hypothetical protein
VFSVDGVVAIGAVSLLRLSEATALAVEWLACVRVLEEPTTWEYARWVVKANRRPWDQVNRE